MPPKRKLPQPSVGDSPIAQGFKKQSVDHDLRQREEQALAAAAAADAAVQHAAALRAALPSSSSASDPAQAAPPSAPPAPPALAPPPPPPPPPLALPAPQPRAAAAADDNTAIVIREDLPAERTPEEMVEDVLMDIIRDIERGPQQDVTAVMTHNNSGGGCQSTAAAGYHKMKVDKTLRDEKQAYDKRGRHAKPFAPSFLHDPEFRGWLQAKRVVRVFEDGGIEVELPGWGMFCLCCTEQGYANTFTQESGCNVNKAKQRATEHLNLKDHKVAFTAKDDSVQFRATITKSIVMEVCATLNPKP